MTEIRQMGKRVPFEQFARSKMVATGRGGQGAPGQPRIVTGDNAGVVAQILNVRDQVLSEVGDSTARQLRNAVAIETEESEVHRLEVQNRHMELIESREDHEDERTRRRDQAEQERLLRMRVLAGPTGPDPVVEQLQTEVRRMSELLQGQKEAVLERELAEIKTRLDRPPAGPAQAIEQIESVLQVSKLITEKFGGNADDRTRQLDLRVEALSRRQKLEEDEAAARHTRERLELEDDLKERQHRRDMEVRKTDQFEGLYGMVGEFLQNVAKEGRLPFGGGGGDAARAATPRAQITPPADMPDGSGAVVTFACPACQAPVSAFERQNYVVCASCHQTLDLTRAPDDTPPPPPVPPEVPPAFLQAFRTDDPDAADRDEHPVIE